MTFKIISADERLKEDHFVKGCIFGQSGVGKTTLIKGLSKEALLVDMEAGDLTLADWKGDSIRIRDYEAMRDLACLIGGVNPSAASGETFSAEHYAEVEGKLGKRNEVLGKYQTIFIDSITVLSRLGFVWAEQQPENIGRNGAKDTRGAYGLMGREIMKLLTHLQHTRDKHIIFVGILDQKQDDFNRTFWKPQMEGAKVANELSGIVDLVLTMAFKTDPDSGKVYRVFYTSADNEDGYPAKDRSGKLKPIEAANLQKIIDKIQSKEGVKT